MSFRLVDRERTFSFDGSRGQKAKLCALEASNGLEQRKQTNRYEEKATGP